MPIPARCPQCRVAFNLADQLAGKVVRCSACSETFRVPAAAPPAAAPLVAVLVDEPAAAGLQARPGTVPPPLPTKKAAKKHNAEQPPPPPSTPVSPWRDILVNSGATVGVLLLMLLLGVLVASLRAGPENADVLAGNAIPNNFNPPFNPNPFNPQGQNPNPFNPPPFNPPPFNPAPFNPPPFNPPIKQNPNPFNPPPFKQPPFNPPPFNPPPVPKPVVLHPEREVQLPAITPAALVQDREVRDLQAPVAGVAVAGGGRYLILHQPELRQLAVFDVSQAKVVRNLQFAEPNFKFAAGADKLLVALPGVRILQRWNLTTFALESSAALQVQGDVTSLTMGSASNGPLVVYAKPAPGQAGFASVSLFNADSLQKIDLPPGAAGFPTDGAFVRAAPDGKLFTLRRGVGGEPHTVSAVRVEADRIAPPQDVWNFASSLLVPSADGKFLYTGSCVTYDTLRVFHPNPPPRSFSKAYLPALHGPYYVRLDFKQWNKLGGGLEFYVQGQLQSFARLNDVEGVTNEQINYGTLRDKLPHDQRVFFIPDAKLIVTIGQNTSQLILRRFDADAVLQGSGTNYLFVTSRPVASARKGNAYTYQLVTKSSKGGVSYRVASGPVGMTVTPDGSVRWSVPANYDRAETDASVAVRDRANSEITHNFRIALRK